MHLFPIARGTPAPETVIVFEPVKVRTGLTGHLIGFAKSALLVWGGISLAGVAGAAALYGTNGLSPYLPTAPASAEAAMPSLRPPEQHVAVAPSPPPVQARPQMQAAVEVPAQGLAALAAKPLILPAAPSPQAFVPASAPLQVSAAAAEPTESMLPAQEPQIAARLPRARPDGVFTIASIERQHEFPRRSRRLRDLQHTFPFANPYRVVRPRFSHGRPREYYRW